ncbi:MAG: PqqD family protein [Gemmatimonadota bacterium]|nr:PqqD family protein [Gemmatimonadota bacterium]
MIALHRDSVAPLFAFTPTAATLWGDLESWATSDSLVERLCERYVVPREQVANDVAGFLDQLDTIGAVQRRESST